MYKFYLKFQSNFGHLDHMDVVNDLIYINSDMSCCGLDGLAVTCAYRTSVLRLLEGRELRETASS